MTCDTHRDARPIGSPAGIWRTVGCKELDWVSAAPSLHRIELLVPDWSISGSGTAEEDHSTAVEVGRLTERWSGSSMRCSPTEMPWDTLAGCWWRKLTEY